MLIPGILITGQMEAVLCTLSMKQSKAFLQAFFLLRERDDGLHCAAEAGERMKQDRNGAAMSRT